MRSLAIFCAVLLTSAIVAPALADPVRVELAPGAVRQCIGETRSTFTYLAGQNLPQPEVATENSVFHATPTSDGYLLEERASTPNGEMILRVQVRADGAIVSAEFSGPAREALQAQSPGLDWSGFALFAARDTPERLMMGRSFNLGDELYPAELAEQLVDGMAKVIRFPPSLRVQGEFRIPFTGVEVVGENSHLVWSGTLHLTGAGPVDGVEMTIDAPVKLRLTVDAATGLVRDLNLGGPMRMSADGRLVAALEFSDSNTCTISRG